MAMARRASVTVSMAAATMGMFNEILRERQVRVSACAGRIEDLPGNSSTSSKVSASGMGPSIIYSPVSLKVPICSKAQRDELGSRKIHLSRQTLIIQAFILCASADEIKRA